jgi:hypothetical protein
MNTGKTPPSGMSILMKSFGLDPAKLELMGNAVADAAQRMIRIEESLGRIEQKLDSLWSEEHGGKFNAGGPSGGGDGGSERGSAIAAD